MISPVGSAELGGIGQAGIIFSTIIIFFQGILYIYIPLYSKIDENKRNIFFSNAILLSIVLAVIIVLIMPLIIEIYKLTGQSSEIVVHVEAYLNVVRWGSLFALPMSICIAMINYNDESKIIVYIVITGNIFNIFFNYIFLYDVLFTQGFSVKGIALSTVITRIITFIISLIYVLHRYNIKFILKINRSYIYQFLKTGIFKGVSYSNEWFASLILVLIVGTAGSTYVSGNQIADLISSIMYMIPQATVTVVVIYLSKAINSSTYTLELEKQLFKYCGYLYLFTLVLGIFLTPYIIKLFHIKQGSEIYSIAFMFMVVHLFFYLAYCYQNFYLAKLDSILDIKFPAIISILLTYIFVIPISLVILYINANVIYIWIIDGICNCILCLIYLNRWKLKGREHQNGTI